MRNAPANKDRFAAGLDSFVTFRLGQVQNRLNAQAAHVLRARSSLSLTEWRVISLINAAGRASAAELLRVSRMDKGQLSRTVKSLVAKGIVNGEVETGTRRQTVLSLSADGKRLHDRIVAVMLERQRHLTGGISDRELEAFYSVLDRLSAASERREF